MSQSWITRVARARRRWSNHRCYAYVFYTHRRKELLRSSELYKGCPFVRSLQYLSPFRPYFFHPFSFLIALTFSFPGEMKYLINSLRGYTPSRVAVDVINRQRSFILGLLFVPFLSSLSFTYHSCSHSIPLFLSLSLSSFFFPLLRTYVRRIL